MPKVESLKRAINRVELELKKDTALSDIEIKQDWDDYIFAVSGNFKDVEALNNAIKIV